MENFGLFKALPKPTLTLEAQSALFRANQSNRKLTRVPFDQFRATPPTQVSKTLSPKNKG